MRVTYNIAFWDDSETKQRNFALCRYTFDDSSNPWKIVKCESLKLDSWDSYLDGDIIPNILTTNKEDLSLNHDFGDEFTSPVKSEFKK